MDQVEPGAKVYMDERRGYQRLPYHDHKYHNPSASSSTT